MEEVAGLLLLFTTSGMDYLLSGWCRGMISSTVVWFYLAVLAPGVARPDPPVAYGQFMIDQNGNVLLIRTQP